MNYGAPPGDFREILKLVARASAGLELLARFLPLWRSGRVRVESYPDALLARLSAELGAGQPVGACFVTDGARGTIYLDPGAPLGILAPFLVHEIVHALDPQVWARAGASGGGARALLSPRLEQAAFELQQAWTSEMRARDRRYDRFLRSQLRRARVLDDLLAPETLAAAYEPDDSA